MYPHRKHTFQAIYNVLLLEACQVINVVFLKINAKSCSDLLSRFSISFFTQTLFCKSNNTLLSATLYLLFSNQLNFYMYLIILKDLKSKNKIDIFQNSFLTDCCNFPFNKKFFFRANFWMENIYHQTIIFTSNLFN